MGQVAIYSCEAIYTTEYNLALTAEAIQVYRCGFFKPKHFESKEKMKAYKISHYVEATDLELQSINHVPKWYFGSKSCLKVTFSQPASMTKLICRRWAVKTSCKGEPHWPWTCVKQNLFCNSFYVLNYTCAMATGTHEVFPAQQLCMKSLMFQRVWRCFIQATLDKLN